MVIIFAALAVSPLAGPRVSVSISASTMDNGAIAARPTKLDHEVCSLLSANARLRESQTETALAYELGEIAPLCRRVLRGRTRASLDRCGKTGDVYASGFAKPTLSPAESTTLSHSTWSTPDHLRERGFVNLADPLHANLREAVLKHADAVKDDAAKFCCQGDAVCGRAFRQTAITFCESNARGDEPDPCVFGGNFRMRGSNYRKVFASIARDPAASPAVLRLVHRNALDTGAPTMNLQSGEILLGKYLSALAGPSSIDATLRHELGHACSMVRMQQAATARDPERALRAVEWLDAVKRRCDPRAELPKADEDYWRSLGESPALAVCLRQLAEANRSRRVDRPCESLCPGHYLEEASGIAFSLLTGDLSGSIGAVYPNTCNHVRDGQHPLVSDVVDCLARESKRFRQRLAETYACRSGS